MLRNTFLHLPGIGYAYERLLWESGVLTWEDFLSAPSLPSALDGRRERLLPLVEESLARHERGDAVFFARVLPPREVWRLYADYRHSAAFLDIETTGLSPYSSYLTLVGRARPGRLPRIRARRQPDRPEGGAGALRPRGDLQRRQLSTFPTWSTLSAACSRTSRTWT